MNIVLDAEWEAFIAESVTSGRYQSATDVVLEALRLLRDESPCPDHTMDDLRRCVDKGLSAIEQGDFRELDISGLKEHLENVKSRGRARLAEMNAKAR